jgi:phosphonate transport system substrate-binding protein
MMKTMLYRVISISLFFAVSTVSAGSLTFGIVPQQSASTLAKRWTPIFQYLSDKTGEDIRFSTAKDIPTFEKRLAAGEYDLAYMNPYHYTVFQQVPGYEAIARQKDKQIKGIIVVSKGSPLKTLADLQDKKMAFPAPAAFAASVIPRSTMEQQGIHIIPQYVSSHESVYLGVARGFFAAGGGVMRTFNTAPPEVRDQLRVLWTTPGYTPHAIAAHPRVSSETVVKIKQALLGMSGDPEGVKLLKTINFKGFALAENTDWDDVRALNIKLLDELIK